MLKRIYKEVLDTYNIRIQDRWTHRFVEGIMALFVGWNYSKYWRRRSYVVDPQKKDAFRKIWYLLYIKKKDARRLSSFGTIYNGGAQYAAPPILPHGPNGIVIAHDAVIGKNVTIFQQVTIACGNGGVHVGDNVLIGAGAKLLNGVHIGNNVSIGANCIVLEDLPDGATCVLQKPRIILHDKDNG